MRSVHRVALLIAVASLGLAGGGQVRAAGDAFGNITVIVGGYETFGAVPGPEGVDVHETVAARLSGPDGTERAALSRATTASGGFEFAFRSTGLAPRRPVLIQPADQISLTALGGHVPPLRLTVPALTAMADPQTDGVSGLAPAGAQLTVTAETHDGHYAQRATVAAGDGSWSTHFTGELDLAAGSHGLVLLMMDGVAFQRDWTLEAVTVVLGDTQAMLTANPGTSLDAELSGPDGRVRATGQAVAWDRTVPLPLYDLDGTPVAIEPGDRLTWHNDLAPPSHMDIPAFTVTVDPMLGTVSGGASAGTRLGVRVPSGYKEVTADADGHWELALTPALLKPDTAVDISLPDVPGVHLTAFGPRVVTLDPYDALLTGVGSAGTPVDFVVQTDTGTERGRVHGQVGPDGTFRLVARTADGAVLPRIGGDNWVVVQGGKLQVMPVSTLTAMADASRDVVSGIVAPLAAVSVRVGQANRVVTADVNGHWSVQFGEPGLAPGDAVVVTTSAEAGYTSTLTFPVFRASAEVNGERVLIEGHAGLSAEAEVDRNGTTVATGGCTVTRTTCAIALRDRTGQPLWLTRGDSVLVLPTDAPSAVLDIIAMTAHIDPSGHDVVGQAPPGAVMRIAFANQPGLPTPLDATTPTDNTGVYDHELSATEWPVMTPGLWADVFLTLPNGHQLFGRAVLEVVRATPGTSTVTGLAEPGARIMAGLTHASAGTDGVAATADSVADGEGRYTLTLRDNASQATAVLPGDHLTVTDGRRNHDLAMAALAAWPVGPTLALAGLTKPETPVMAVHSLRFGAPAGRVAIQTDTSDASGEVVIDPPSVAPADRTGVMVVATLPDGDELTQPVDLELRPGRCYLPMLNTPAAAAP